MYGKFDTLILDDPFSALDADTEARVFSALFGPGGLLQSTSVILATHQLYRLSHGSFITILSEGKVAEQGTYDELYSRGDEGIMRQLMDSYASKGKALQAQASSSNEVEDKPLAEAVAVKATNYESRQGVVAWSTYGLYLRSMGYGHATIWLLFVFLAATIQVTVGIYLQAWTSTLTSEPSRYGAFLGGYAGMEMGFLFAFSVAVINAFIYAHPIASRKLHAWMLNGVLRYVLA